MYVCLSCRFGQLGVGHEKGIVYTQYINTHNKAWLYYLYVVMYNIYMYMYMYISGIL